MKIPYYARYAFAILLLAVFALPIMSRGARNAVEHTSNDFKKWLPEGFEETRELDWFRENFVGEQFVVVSWDGCTLDDPRLEMLAKKVVPPEGTPLPDGQPRYFKSVITGRQVLEQMTDPEGSLQLSRKEAIRRLSGSLIGRDGDTTCLIATLTSEGLDNLRLALGNTWPLTRILFGRSDGVMIDLASQCAIDKNELMMGGPPIDNVAIDDEGEITLMRLAGLSGLIGLIASWYCFRSKRVTAFVFCSGLYSAMISMAIVWYSGGQVDAVMMSMPSVVYVLGISGAIHLINYYKDAVRETGVATAPGTAVRHAWVPCTLAAFTTALGLGSLAMSEILPIRNFGVYAATGVLGTLLLLLALLPALLQLWPPMSKKKDKNTAPELVPSAAPPEEHSVWYHRLMACGDWVVARNGLVTAASLLVMFGLAAGLFRTTTTVQLLKLFSPSTDIIQDYTWLETNIGDLVPMEVVVRVDKDRQRGIDETMAMKDGHYQLSFLERMELVSRVQKKVEAMPEVGKALAITTFAPKLPGYNAPFSTRSAYNSGLQQHIDEYLDGDYLRESEEGEQLFRISARLPALAEENKEDVDYGVFVQDIRTAVEPIMTAYHQRDRILHALVPNGEPHRNKHVMLVGLPIPVAKKAVAQKADAQEAVAEGEEPIAEPAPLSAEMQARVDMATTLYALLKSNGLKVSWLHDGVEAEKAPRYVEAAAKADLVFAMADHATVDYNAITENAPLAIDARVLDPLRPIESDSQLTAVYTGVVPLVYKAQRTLLDGLVNSIGLAFALICVVMIAILRSPSAGILSMLPNVFPVATIFGAMGWLGIEIDIGTMMTASVAMGVAVDDTLHFLTWFRRGILQGLDRRGAIRLAYDRCASAMMQTTIIGGLGLGVFIFSTFTPTQRFGYLMATLLAAAIVGDLIFLPALLASPVGRLFTGGLKPKKGTQDSSATPEESTELPEGLRIHDTSQPAPHFGTTTGAPLYQTPPIDPLQTNE